MEDLSRADVARNTEHVLSRGGARNPDVLRVSTPTGPVVVKDFAPRGRLVRSTLGRWITRREMRAYAALADHPSVPRLLGRIDALAFVIEYRPGERLASRNFPSLPPSFAEDLALAIRGMHERGVAHLDLSHRSNILIDAQGRPILIDFGSAVAIDPTSLAGRLLLPWLRRFDARALRKWSRKVERARRAAALRAKRAGAES